MKNQLHNSLVDWLRQNSLGAVADTGLSTAYFGHHLERVGQALAQLDRGVGLDVLFFTHRPEYFDRADIETHSSSLIHSVTFCSTEEELWHIDKTFDLAICCTHLTQDHLPQLAIRSRDLAKVIVAWAWDNHHDAFHNLCNASLADIVLPAHAYCRHHLKLPQYLLGRTTPLCTAQWERRFSRNELLRSRNLARSNSLQGGYILWGGSARNEVLHRLSAEIPGNSIELIDADQRNLYFSLSAEARFRKWRSCKASIQVSLDRDVSLRIFDALLTGQIPIVPATCSDLDLVVPAELQETLPIIRIPDLASATVEAAWLTAIERFDAMGDEGIFQRHEFAREKHHIISRLDVIVGYVLSIAGNLQASVCVDAIGLGLEISD